MFHQKILATGFFEYTVFNAIPERKFNKLWIVRLEVNRTHFTKVVGRVKESILFWNVCNYIKCKYYDYESSIL